MQGKEIKDAKARDEVLLNVKLNLAKQLLVKKIAKNKVRILMNFLKYYVRFENPDINSKFEEQVEILTERSTTMGIEELLLDRAEKRGQQQKSHDVVENLISELGLSDDQIARIAEVSIEFVQKVRAQLKK
ncbi:hypothetical protein [Pedobacter ginsengisoli]|uniref:hypothetical protein n=1 Tax=Pedobacter ginsengisoli TaxID=363852 RepID=UPI00254FEB8F|nr:hypothetical protein [Pedobacter ginsengisoli]